MAQKLPYGLKRHLIKATGATYHDITKVVNGTSTDVKLIESVTLLLAEYKLKQQELATQLASL